MRSATRPEVMNGRGPSVSRRDAVRAGPVQVFFRCCSLKQSAHMPCVNWIWLCDAK